MTFEAILLVVMFVVFVFVLVEKKEKKREKSFVLEFVLEAASEKTEIVLLMKIKGLAEEEEEKKRDVEEINEFVSMGKKGEEINCHGEEIIKDLVLESEKEVISLDLTVEILEH